MSKNLYKELKNKQQQEVNNFPMFFAFSREQFEEGIKELGLTKDDRDKIHSIGAGGFIKRSDSEAMNEMFSKHEKEIEEAIISDQIKERVVNMFNRNELTLLYAALDDYIRTTDELFSDGEISEQDKENKDTQAMDLKRKVLSMI